MFEGCVVHTTSKPEAAVFELLRFAGLPIKAEAACLGLDLWWETIYHQTPRAW
jgi:hypothetical protein